MNILEQLIQRGVLKEAQASEVLRIAREKYEGDTEKALIDFGVNEQEILKVKSEIYGMPFRVVDPKTVSFDILKFIPEDSAKHYKFVPISLEGDILDVGVIDPGNIQAMDALQFIANKSNINFRVFLISTQNFEKILSNYEGMTGQVDSALSELGDDDIGELEKADLADVVIEDINGKKELTLEEEKKIVEEAPVIKIVSVILRYAIDGNASDIHIESTGEKVKVRFRVDGELRTSLWLPITAFAGVVARIKILAKLRLDEKRKPQDGNFSAKVNGRKIDFRVSTLPTKFGEKVVIRILDSEKGIRTLESLGISEDYAKIIREALKKPHGIILITGPTGSGKSTTLYAMLQELDREKWNVVSLEDPIEYKMDSVSQSQVMPEIGYTFASGLRSILRQDPDIIMVGEIRDTETAQLAIQAALTGHLVLSTLHTNSAIGAVPRLVDMGIDPYLIAPTLELSIAQRLSRVICDGAAEEQVVDESVQKMLDKEFQDMPEEFRKKLPLKNKVFQAKSTAECPTGVKGRTVVMEMFNNTDQMKQTILHHPTEDEIYKVARAQGMRTMREDAILKSMEGKIPFNEVYNY
ncbi:Flp pilus assembly complex ATPase component TadA [Candidatus Nomurabacteria bacterium]|nr:Flp pilus assembly complex ATPase component TadA [Candidatus Nomurabacteria bacterium]MCB9820818.1 Flp pilus assembly complex ATPase component TadA [Candidatus Nomurabacteria bacterium]